MEERNILYSLLERGARDRESLREKEKENEREKGGGRKGEGISTIFYPLSTPGTQVCSQV